MDAYRDLYYFHDTCIYKLMSNWHGMDGSMLDKIPRAKISNKFAL